MFKEAYYALSHAQRCRVNATAVPEVDYEEVEKTMLIAVGCLQIAHKPCAQTFSHV